LGGRGGQQPQERAARQREIAHAFAGPAGRAKRDRLVSAAAGGRSSARSAGELEPALTDPSKFQAVDFQIVLPGYFEVLHTPLIAGRTFTDADNRPTARAW
jgi:hypothetical protein